MKAKEANFLRFLHGAKQFIIPIYQRTYSWQLKQCEQLLKDIISINQDQQRPGHFIGSIGYFDNDGNISEFSILKPDGSRVFSDLDGNVNRLIQKDGTIIYFDKAGNMVKKINKDGSSV